MLLCTGLVAYVEAGAITHLDSTPRRRRTRLGSCADVTFLVHCHCLVSARLDRLDRRVVSIALYEVLFTSICAVSSTTCATINPRKRRGRVSATLAPGLAVSALLHAHVHVPVFLSSATLPLSAFKRDGLSRITGDKRMLCAVRCLQHSQVIHHLSCSTALVAFLAFLLHLSIHDR
ncbi:hypothetical protein FA95DRAFT_1297626 [Auriscalpium vulgare]|uniref:Uncharacterized protein n=1 Tax=Auriscalpium vulgare TaxID=40419 RepID=A0ACB8R3G0_9AGAM|nr:hypothetical protein FA95DRAFT_1297626 [Auriscalpium vulgare]